MEDRIRSMIAPSTLSRAAPVVASFALHLAVGATLLAMGPAWTARTPTVIIDADLIPEPPPEPERREPEKKIVRPAPAPPKPVTPPRPIEPPRPQVVEPPATPAPPPVAPAPRVEAPSPPTVAAEPSAPAAPPLQRRSEPSGAAIETPPGAGPSRSGPATPAPSPAPPTPPATARVAPEAPPTQFARPTGGYQVKPSYPASARRLGIEGTALLRVYVAADGQVTDVQVDTSAGHPDLDRAATDAVRRWRFEPGRRGAEPIGMWVRLPVQFVLK